MQHNYQEAFETFESSIPKAETTTSLMAYFFALSGKTAALLWLGRFGALWQILQAGKQMRKRTAMNPGSLIFARHGCALLFSISTALVDSATSSCAPMRSIALDSPRRSPGLPQDMPSFTAVNMTRLSNTSGKFVIRKRLPSSSCTGLANDRTIGLSNVWLASGDLAKARGEADAFLESALSTVDPHVQALAWEMKTRIAIAEQAWEAVADHLHEALSIVESFAVQWPHGKFTLLRGTSSCMQRMRPRPRVIALLPKRISSPSPIPSWAMILFADHSCPRLPCGGFSTKHQPQRSHTDVFD